MDKDAQYYFALQAGNGCAVSPYSNEISVNVPTPTFTANPPTQLNLTNTATDTSNSPSISQNIQPAPTGSVLGESISQTPQKSKNPLETLFDNRKAFPRVKNVKSGFTLFIFPLLCITFFYFILKNRRN